MNIKLLNRSDMERFIVNNPKSRLEKYFSSPDYREFVDYASKKSLYNFDAMVLEDIAMRFINGNYSDENIKKISLDIVKQSAEIILEDLEKIKC